MKSVAKSSAGDRFGALIDTRKTAEHTLVRIEEIATDRAPPSKLPFEPQPIPDEPAAFGSSVEFAGSGGRRPLSVRSPLRLWVLPARNTKTPTSDPQ